MKVAIIGGGPAGLYAAILLKKQRPAADITVYERNRADDTFGFGVVFSDATLDNFEKHDLPSYRRITQEFAYWDDIAVHFRGTVHRVGGNGFCGCSRRKLLLILQERARELGVVLHFEVDIDDESRFADADLILIADGINSRFREKYVDHFQPEVDIRSNKFAWMGSTRPLDAFTFIFQETEWGPFIAHAYQYEAGHSTWIFETDPETFERAGLTGLDEAQSAARMADIFGWFLGEHRLLTNRSMWRNFPMIRSKRWVKDNMVLLGDAKASAHFSIGSGTKLAMEDAIALAEAMEKAPSIEAALEVYEHGRREEVEKTQHAADVSLVWFEHVDRFWDFDPVQFAFGVMTRSKAITYDNLKLRAPDFVAEVEKSFARQVRSSGFDVDTDRPMVPLFQPLRLRENEARQSCGDVADVHVFGEGGCADRLPPGSLRLARDRRRRADLHRDDLRQPRCPDHARLRRPVERRAGSRMAPHCGFRPRQLGGKDLPSVGARRSQGRNQADVGRYGPASG
ncbi:2-polyprenyl-6-methoxyphenol hydroxylase-like FAD-dependent oxidoreductase [Bradyrhizobium liaoningense]